MTEQEKKQILDAFGLYIFRDGSWHQFASYAAEKREQAERDAALLRQSGDYLGVCLVSHKLKKILFSYDGRGSGVNYDLVTSGQSVANPLSRDNFIELRQRGGLPNEETAAAGGSSLFPTLTFLGSLLLGGGVFQGAAEAGLPSNLGGMMAGAIVLLGALLALLTARTGKNEATHAADTRRQKALAQCQKVFSENVHLARGRFWNQGARHMEGDTHFALLLFLAGQARVLSEKLALPVEEMAPVVATCTQAIGLERAMVENFFNNQAEYLLYPRYQHMYDSGARAAHRKLENPEAESGLVAALENWLGESGEGNQADEESRMAAVLFTDIVNFTSSHQAQGDIWMVDVVRAHNEIVRDVLKHYRGREVKHTGDGIMASFSSAIGALKAAVAMQKGFIRFSEAMPDRAFEVRVGISAGEPVHMGNDLFGTPVNMAARVMPFANGREIAVSQSCYDVCKGQFSFQELPDCELKGFDGTHTVYKMRVGEPLPKVETAPEVAGETPAQEVEVPGAEEEAPSTEAEGKPEEKQEKADPFAEKKTANPFLVKSEQEE